MTVRISGVCLGLLSAVLAWAQEDVAKEVRGLLRSARDRRAEAAEFRRAAHESLDVDRDEEAVARNRRSRELLAEARELQARAEGLAAELCRRLLPLLDSDDVEERDRATKEILSLGAATRGALAQAPPDASPELRVRVEMILQALNGLDDEGLLHQWAGSARASSEFSSPSWAATQATGPPDTLAAGDLSTAWASRERDAETEWIELTYDVPVVPTLVRVRETYNPGAVVRIEARAPEGSWRTAWSGEDTTKECPGWLEVRPEPLPWAVTAIRLTLASGAVDGWNEIDAVELVGEPR